MKDKIIQYVNKNKKWLFDTLMDIVSKDTINRMPYGNENNGQYLIEDIFKKLGLEVDRFSPDEVRDLKNHEAYLKGRDYSNRDNVVGFTGKGSKKTIIFNGHVDTVPTENLNWTKTDPLSPKMIGNKIYGIGACDMKGGLVSSIFALKTIIDLGIDIEGKVILESVIDEEFGGANGTLACIERGYEGDFAIIPEPTGMNICPTAISQKLFSIFIKGGQGIKTGSKADKNEIENPIFLAGKLLNALLDYEKFLNSLKSKHKMYSDQEKPIFFVASGIRAGEVKDEKLWTTPKECILNVCVRNYPEYCEKEEKFDEMLFSFLNKYPDIKRNIENKNIIFKKGFRFFPGPKFNLNSKSNKNFISKLIESSQFALGKKLIVTGSNFGGDLFIFNNFSNTPAIFLGPGGGNIHAADEYVNTNDIVDLSKIFALFIYDCCC